jgi:hypothetical protein
MHPACAGRCQTICIRRGSPWEVSHCESFRGKPRNELLNGEICCALREAQVAIDKLGQLDDRVRSRIAPSYRLLAPESMVSNVPMEG